MNYDLWIMSVVDRVGYLLDIDTDDAEGIVEAQPFILSQSWGKGLSFEDTADLIIEASKL